MTLKIKDVLISAEGRDKGKLFRLTEMPAAQVERWAFRAFQALAKAGVDMPANMLGGGIAAFTIVGLKALAIIPHVEAFELMDEMMSRVSIIRDHSKPEITQPILDSDIEEWQTRLKLRDELFELHTGFSLAGAMSKLSSTPATSPDSSSTETSPE